MLKFTRLLYCYDEVCINLLISIFEQDDFKKSIFWAAELFCSGFEKEIWQILWKIYYEFYALTNPTLQRKIIGRYKKFEKTNEKETNDETNQETKEKTDIYKFEQIMAVLQIFYSNIPTAAIFIINNMYKKPIANKTFEELSKKIKEADISANIKLFIKNFYISVKKYPKETEKLVILMTKKKIKTNPFHNDLFLQYINHLFTYTLLEINKSEEEKVVHPTMKINKHHKKYMKKLVLFETNKKPYTTLQCWRDYEISDYTSSFQLERQKIDIKQEFWYHWEYYAMGCLFWSEKIKSYKGKKNKKDKEIQFPSDDMFEAFYEKYNYDIDEVDKNTQNKSIKELDYGLTVPDMMKNKCKHMKIKLQLDKKIDKNKFKYI